MEFEWDEAKRLKNVVRHKLDFVAVMPLFNHRQSVRFVDDRKDYGEDRFVMLCENGGILFHVTYTMRGNRIRIISARRGGKREMRRYEQERKDRKSD